MVHVVFDTKGAGRIVGVFEDAERATRICAVDPPYFRLVSVEVGEINPAALDWLNTEEKRTALMRA